MKGAELCVLAALALSNVTTAKTQNELKDEQGATTRGKCSCQNHWYAGASTAHKTTRRA